jgi:hypothetical protein
LIENSKGIQYEANILVLFEDTGCSVYVYNLNYESEYFCENILCSFLVWAVIFIKMENKVQSLWAFDCFAVKYTFVGRRRGNVEPFCFSHL